MSETGQRLRVFQSFYGMSQCPETGYYYYDYLTRLTMVYRSYDYGLWPLGSHRADIRLRYHDVGLGILFIHRPDMTEWKISYQAHIARMLAMKDDEDSIDIIEGDP